MPAEIALWCVAAFLLLAMLAVACGRSRVGTVLVYGLSFLIAGAALGNAAMQLATVAPASKIALPLGVPWIGSHFRLDSLAAVFLTIINLGGLAASLYGLGYGRHAAAPLRVLPFFPAFLGAMNLVVLADDAYTFLFCWELMSLASWAMVMADHRAAATARAGFVYLVMASFGTLALLLGFSMLAGLAGGYGFDAIRANPPSAMHGALALALVLIGTGSKAGLVPLHVWLPLAHPAAPSHVSALLSGVMTKVAVYAFVRVAFDLIGPAQWWWSIAVLVLGAVTAVVGLLYAILQSDLKRLLAYSTIENIGVIFTGLGLALAFKASAMPGAAALALTAALFHALNHAMFKSLLFFGAGAVVTATGTRDMEKLGGLIHRMPQTAFVFLVGCAAIAALPPLNGFVSEWLLFQAVLVSLGLPQWGMKFLIPAVGALLALAAALAAACFVKAFGITFLGRPRSKAAEEAVEVDGFSRAAMFMLAALCLGAGVLPGYVIDLLAPAVELAVGARLPTQSALPWLSIVPTAESRSSYNGIVILAFLIMAAGLTAFFIHRVASRKTRRAPIWDCGYPLVSSATQYTGSSFAMPVRRVFGTSVFHVREKLDMPSPGEMRPGHYQVRTFDPAWRFGYGPLLRLVEYASGKVNRLQFLTIRRYLMLVFGALILFMLLVAAWR